MFEDVILERVCPHVEDPAEEAPAAGAEAPTTVQAEPRGARGNGATVRQMCIFSKDLESRLSDWFRTGNNLLIPEPRGWHAAKQALNKNFSRESWRTVRRAVAKELDIRLRRGPRRQ
jgi:hypothetical protein